MWKKYRGSFLSFILIIGLVLSGLSMPSYVSAAPPATDNVTNTPVVLDHSMVFFQNGQEITQTGNNKVDLTTDITATIKDKFKFDKNATHHITDNSYVEYELGAPFILPNGVLSKES